MLLNWPQHTHTHKHQFTFTHTSMFLPKYTQTNTYVSAPPFLEDIWKNTSTLPQRGREGTFVCVCVCVCSHIGWWLWGKQETTILWVCVRRERICVCVLINKTMDQWKDCIMFVCHYWFLANQSQLSRFLGCVFIVPHCFCSFDFLFADGSHHSWVKPCTPKTKRSFVLNIWIGFQKGFISLKAIFTRWWH